MFIKNENVILVNESGKKESFFCKLCKFPFLSKEDFLFKEKYDCCHECYMEFAECRKNKWIDGWRPTKEELSSYLKVRKQLSENIIKIK